MEMSSVWGDINSNKYMEDDMRWYEEKEGSVSTMRILSMSAGLIGLLISLAGVVAVFLKLSGANTILTVSLGMLGLAFGGKGVQKFAERTNKE